MQVKEGFYNLTFHQLTADEVLAVMFSDVGKIAPLEIRQVERSDVYADCAELFESGDYKLVAVIKE